MDVYSHVSPDMQEEAVRKVEERLRKFGKGGVETRTAIASRCEFQV
jgi:hypothetical protein